MSQQGFYFNPFDPEFRANPYPHFPPLLEGSPRQLNLFMPTTLIARYADVELLVRVGEYQKGTDPIADEAIAKIERINAFLRQSSSERVSLIQTRQHMREIVQ